MFRTNLNDSIGGRTGLRRGWGRIQCLFADGLKRTSSVFRSYLTATLLVFLSLGSFATAIAQTYQPFCVSAHCNIYAAGIEFLSDHPFVTCGSDWPTQTCQFGCAGGGIPPFRIDLSDDPPNTYIVFNDVGGTITWVCSAVGCDDTGPDGQYLPTCMADPLICSRRGISGLSGKRGHCLVGVFL